MARDLKAFWNRFQSGIDVAVADASSEELLGVRDGFLRYFHERLDQALPVAVVPSPTTVAKDGAISLSDTEAAHRAALRAAELESSLGDTFHFFVGTEGTIHPLEIDGESHHFVRSWTAIRSLAGVAFGGSGSVGLPAALWSPHEATTVSRVPGTRRGGGLISSLTGGLERRRSAVRLATFNALSTLFYGVIDVPRRRSGQFHPS